MSKMQNVAHLMEILVAAARLFTCLSFRILIESSDDKEAARTIYHISSSSVSYFLLFFFGLLVRLLFSFAVYYFVTELEYLASSLSSHNSSPY